MNINDIAAQIPHYRLLELLGESLESLVFKAVSKHNQNDYYILKLFKNSIKQENQRRYLRQKVERLKIIHDSRVITPSAFECFGDMQFILQHYFPGQPLSTWSNHQAIRLEKFFPIASELALILNAVHDAGIIHGGVKPHNILLQPETLAVRLTDFITPIDIREISHFIYDQSFVEGTLAYTSPEQTGRINHRVDFSTDMYSLGIVFYQLLTGQLPFTSIDPLELIHSHLAEEALPVNQVNPQIPEILGEMIAKMCLKEPEKRYQSGIGLYADLQRCADEYQASKQIKPFKIGLHDHRRRVIFISKMVGRNAEAQVILNQYQQVIKGGFGSVFISGLPGIGKTRLIQELQRPLVEHRGYFTSGKFDQYQKNIPYSSLLQALRNLIRTLLTESDARVALWRQRILDTVGLQGRVICDVIPELNILIGEQPEVPSLPPVEARHRFNNLFGQFLACLAQHDYPLILFIDDLQWCDSATFDFLGHLFANTADYPYLFFIGAYRNNEVDSHHPLSQLMRSMLEYRLPLNDLRLTALNAKDCHEMVAYILDLPSPQCTVLALFIADLTEGNPLFVSESLSWLHNEQLLNVGDDGQWGWDMEKIRRSDMPTTVVELFSSKVKQLAPETVEILMLCACMGNRFAAEEVSLIQEISLQTLFERLKPVLSLGLLMESKTELQFVHDRVQEAVLRFLNPEQRRAIHWQVGQHLLADKPIDVELEQQDNLFTIVAHLNLGRTETLTKAESLTLAQLNFHAGNKALNALATLAANEYYHNGIDLLPIDAWENNYSLTFRLHQRLAKTELMAGRYESSEKLLNTLLSRAADDLDRAEALAEQTTSLSSIGNFIKAIETANRGLNYFDKALPDDATKAAERTAQLMAQIHESGRDVWQEILNMPFTQERRSKIELAFYSELIPDLYMSGLVPQLYLSAAQSTLHCLQGGMDESVIYSFSIMGLNLGEQGQFELAFRYQDLAHDLCARYPDTFGATRGINGIVWCNMHSRSHPAEIVAYCRKGIQSGKNCGDLYNAGLNYGPLMWNLQVQGANFHAIEETAAACLEFSKKNQLSFSVGLAEAVQAGWIEPMKNASAALHPMAEKLALWESCNHVASAGSYFVHLAMCHYYYGRHQEADQCLQTVKQYLTGLTDNVLKRQWYVFQALNALRLQRQKNTDKQLLLKQIQELIAPVETWAKLGVLLQPYLQLYWAECACCFSDFASVCTAYLQAIEAARRQNYTFLEGFTNECFGDWLQDNGYQSCDGYWREAIRLYRKCGAQGKEIQLLERCPACCDEEHERVADTSAIESPDKLVLPNLDVDYLVKSSLALSAEIDQKKLLEKIMGIVLQSSGAQHGYLLVHELNDWAVRAASHITEEVSLETQLRPLHTVTELCQGIVHYACRTGEPIVLADAQTAAEFRDLPEVSQLGLRSLLCLPLHRQGILVGLLYLENRLAPNVFTAERVRITELLCQQVAISLENARLIAEIGQFNAELEQRVAEAVAQNREKDHLLMQQSRLAMMGEMINNIAHQWRQPLNALGLVLGNLEDAARFNDLTEDYLKKQIAEGWCYIQKMSSTINDFRNFFRPNKQPEIFSLKTAIAGAVALVDASFKAHCIDLIIDAPKDLHLTGFPNEYSQVLLNLLTNAKEAILAHCDNGGQILVQLSCENDCAQVKVTDTGGGIDEKILSRLFEPYFSTKETGTGIGLYMSKMIIENSMNGQISFRNLPQGAEFTITMPLNMKNETA
jgi:predicted ATPase/signal transduction histidine kinase/tRNA A-37 threonylcarbamoyl transferase component Bud32